FWPALLVLAVTLPLAWLLMQLPVLSFGWWTALGGVGNPVFGGTNRGLGALDVLIPVVFVALLLIGLPLLVAREEWMFRRGAELRGGWSNTRRALLFGLAHAVV